MGRPGDSRTSLSSALRSGPQAAQARLLHEAFCHPPGCSQGMLKMARGHRLSPHLALSSLGRSHLCQSALLRHFSRVQPFVTPWTMACQAPLVLGFSRQEYWSGLPFPSPTIKKEVSEVKSLSRVPLFATPWTAAHQAPPSLGFSRQEHWSGLPFPSPKHESEK